jgi:hypothetical protein
MPEWVIVGVNERGDPLVLTDWIVNVEWTEIAAMKEAGLEPVIFRDRWRAKRQARRWFVDYKAMCIRRSRL